MNDAERNGISHYDHDLKEYLFAHGAKWLFRIGSSLHDEWFTSESDVDYLCVIDEISSVLVADFPHRTSPLLPEERVRYYRDNFFWRVTMRSIDGHDATVNLYTTKKFLHYVKRRSPAQEYILHEHLLLLGDEAELDRLKTANPPNIETARQDLAFLQEHSDRFPWAWRSVSVMEGHGWLANKDAVTAYVTKHHEGQLHDRAYLLTLLRFLTGEEDDNKEEEEEPREGRLTKREVEERIAELEKERR